MHGLEPGKASWTCCFPHWFATGQSQTWRKQRSCLPSWQSQSSQNVAHPARANAFLAKDEGLPVAVENFKAPLGSTLKQHTSKDGKWRVRPVREEEVPLVAEIQAAAFYEPLPLFGPFNKTLQYGFQAEVLSGSRQKLKYSARDGFVCLVAESTEHPHELVGVVEVSLQSAKAELAALDQAGFQELLYAYVACMAVRLDHRRKGIASELLKAAEIQAGKWNQNWVLLHVYTKNTAGVALYRQTGYTDIYKDPDWQAALGRKQRFLFAKQAAVTGPAGVIQSISQNVMELWQKTNGTDVSAS